jgi:hypothetical protein
MNHEELLRDTLATKAAEASVDLTLDDIRRGANRRRSRSRRTAVVVLAAAAAVVVGVPAAILLRPAGDQASPAPSPSPTATTPSSSPWPEGLDGIARGKDPQVAYLQGRVVHQPDGSTARLPDGSSFVARFTPYHGGWLLLDDIGGLRQYDNTGALVLRSTTGEASLAVSGDQMRTAFLFGGHLHVGIATGMGQGESDLPVGTNARLVGFLGDSVVLNAFPDSPHVVDTGTRRTTLVPGLQMAWCAAASGDLVGGTIHGDKQGRVVSMSGARTLWTGDWVPVTFSPDGKHVLAVPVSSLNEPQNLAILDSRTGKVVSQFALAGRDLAAASAAVWEPDGDAVLFDARETQGAVQAVLRLGVDGTVTLATDPAPSNDENPAWIFAAQP